MARGTARLLADKACDAIVAQRERAETEYRDHLKRLVERDVLLDLLLDCMQRSNQTYHAACTFITDPLADAAAQRRAVGAMQRITLATIARQILSITSH